MGSEAKRVSVRGETEAGKGRTEIDRVKKRVAWRQLRISKIHENLLVYQISNVSQSLHICQPLSYQFV